MFYAVEHRYGKHVVNGDKTYYEFTSKRLRDAFVRAGTDNFTAPGYREVADSRSAKRADFRADGDPDGWRALAERRVDQSPALRPYRYELVDYDWGNNNHWRFTATAKESEIVSWAKSTRDGMYADE